MWRTRDLGTSRGRCGSCGALADLHLRESSYRRRWHEALREDIDERIDRRVTCSVCRRTYPVRGVDGDPTAAADRGLAPVTTRPAGSRRARDT